MDPTDAELAAIGTLAEAKNWAGVEGAVQAALDTTLGSPQRVREIALIPRTTWNAAVEGIKVEDTDPAAVEAARAAHAAAGLAGDPPAPTRALNPVEKARVESLRRVCNLRVGRPADDTTALNPLVPPAVPGPPLPTTGGGTPSSSGHRRIKLSAVLDPTLEADIIMLAETEVTAMYDKYRTRFGDFPSAESDVSRDQLASIQQITQAGAIPFADFSVFGPFGQRLLRKLTYMGYQLNPTTGDWIRKELPGPGSFHEWYRCWKCYRTAMLLTESCEAERLDAYSEMIRGFVQQYGEDAWSFISRADSRMRSEHLERLRRTLRASPQYGFQENQPWSACYAAAIKDNEFWQRELATPVLMFVARNKRADPKEPRDDDALGASPKRSKHDKGTRAKRRHTGEDKSKKGPDGTFQLNRKGIEVCALYNQGKCGSDKAQGRCKNSRSHQCNKCLGPHQGLKCNRSEWQEPTGAQEAGGSTKRHRDTPADEDNQPSSSKKPRTSQAAYRDQSVHEQGQQRAKPKVGKVHDKSKIIEAQVGNTKYYTVDYGAWSYVSKGDTEQPTALIVFSGRPRPNDLHHELVALGWVVCSLDVAAPLRADLLDDSIWEKVLADVRLGLFDGVWVATPCGTFSPLRERRPGPKPLRSVQQIQGLGKDKLTPGEQKQVKEANILVSRSAAVCQAQGDRGKAFGLENPDHPQDKPSLWLMPSIQKLEARDDVNTVLFDQCRTGLETVKPTKLLVKDLDLEELQGLRCNHPPVDQVDAQGRTYKAPHGTTVQKWVKGPWGQMERASRSQGEYTGEFSKIIAGAMHKAWKRAELKRDPLPWHAQQVIEATVEVAPKQKEVENLHAIGGMRNPHLSIKRLPFTTQPGEKVRLLFLKAQELWPELRETAKGILTNGSPKPFQEEIVSLLRRTTLTLLGSDGNQRLRSARANTPISSSVLAEWGKATRDPDAGTLAAWLDNGAPMGFLDPIERNGIFPAATNDQVEDAAATKYELEGWENYKSAVEEKEELDRLVDTYVSKGWCRILPSLEEARQELGEDVVLNKLGVIVKYSEQGTKKARIIWDLRQSGANTRCDHAERIVLPKLTDVAAAGQRAYAQGCEPWLLALDVADAFLNIPVARDKAMTLSAKPDQDGTNRVVVCDTLVFGAKSSPTIWGRFAAFLGRSLASVEPQANTQIYVDDAAVVLTGDLETAAQAATNVLLWAAVCGFPIKLEKCLGGKQIKWIGAQIKLDDEREEVAVTIPSEKRQKLFEAVVQIAKKPMVSQKALATLAGGLSFVAGLVPIMKPFLDSFWAALANPGHKATVDGVKRPSGKLIHVRRIAKALQWVAALLRGDHVPLRRTFGVISNVVEATITTDASPWGVGGVLRVKGRLEAAFAEPLNQHVLSKFNATRGDPKFTTLWEGLALLIAFRLWLPLLGFGASVRVKSDSLSSLLMLSKGRAKSIELNVIAREIALDQAFRLYRLTFLEHIPGVTNLEADYLSRIHSPKPPVKPGQLEAVTLTPVEIGEGFWKVLRLDKSAGWGKIERSVSCWVLTVSIASGCSVA